MTIKIICHHCKSILYEDIELISPREIVDKYDSRCPKCSAFLNFDPSKLKINVNERGQRGIFKLFQKKGLT
ncbi:MAG: hypothetical protein ACUVQ5_03045 [Candidatus Methanomethylicaceae archaeon]